MVFYLGLKYNRLSNITNGTFKGLKNLKELDVSNNRIRDISSRSFGDLVNLQTLNLSNNNLEAINFWIPTRIAYIYFEFNRISFIDKDSFKNTPILSTLTLNDNIIKSLSTDIFYNTNLQKLELRHNKLSDIEPGSLRRTELRKPLDLIDLSFNNLSQIRSGDYNTLRTQILDLSNNQIKTIEKDAFLNSNFSLN